MADLFTPDLFFNHMISGLRLLSLIMWTLVFQLYFRLRMNKNKLDHTMDLRFTDNCIMFIGGAIMLLDIRALLGVIPRLYDIWSLMAYTIFSFTPSYYLWRRMQSLRKVVNTRAVTIMYIIIITLCLIGGFMVPSKNGSILSMYT